MTEKIVGIVKFSNVLQQKNGFGPKGILLRPVESWNKVITIGNSIKLVFPNGEIHYTKIKGGELPSYVPEKEPFAMLVEDLNTDNNEVPSGTLVYMNEIKPL